MSPAITAFPNCPQPPPTGPSTAPVWIIEAKALQGLDSYLTSNHMSVAVAQSYLNNPKTYVLASSSSWQSSSPGQATWPIPADFANATPVAQYTDAANLQADLANIKAKGPFKFKDTLLDIEAWGLTPQAQQNDPVTAYTNAAGVSFGTYHLPLLATPTPNLAEVPTTVLPVQPTGKSYLDFYNDQVAGQLAAIPGISVIDIQSQGSDMYAESATAAYCTFTQADAKQITDANPNVVPVAGLTTNVPGTPTNTAVSPPLLEADVQWVDHTVGGFWFNDPSSSTACKTCQAFPDVTSKFLNGINNSSHWPPS